MRRASLVALAGVLVWGLLGMQRMRDDVAEELAGARALASLFEQLSTASQQVDDAQAQRLLSGWSQGHAPRHLSVRVSDEHGRLLLSADPEGDLPGWMQPVLRLSDGLFHPAPPFTVSWVLARPEGRRWTVAATAAPQSERAEALVLLATGTGVLALAAVGMLLVMTFNTRRAMAPLARLVAAIRAMGDGAGGHAAVRQLPAMPVAELATIAQALQRLDLALADTQAQRQQLARQLQALQEEERSRLAQELHDEFGQRLTALRANASWLQRRLSSQPDELAVAREVSVQCEAIQQDIRGVLARLRAPGLHDQATVASLGTMLSALVAAWPAERLRAVPSLQLAWRDRDGRDVDWDEQAPRHHLPAELGHMLYRISQEALTNVARHAAARTVMLSVVVQARAGGGATLRWAVQDDGRGLGVPAQALARGSGLAGIKQRLWAQGAELQLSAGEGGCRLSADILVEWVGAEDA